jgi:branched-chain amino acid transport system permease protein
VAVIGGLGRVEGAWLGALAFIVINNYIRDSWLTELLDDVRIGGSFNTIIGLVFLAIVIVSPDGLIGLWDRLWGLATGSRDPDRPAMAPSPAGQQS